MRWSGTAIAVWAALRGKAICLGWSVSRGDRKDVQKVREVFCCNGLNAAGPAARCHPRREATKKELRPFRSPRDLRGKRLEAVAMPGRDIEAKQAVLAGAFPAEIARVYREFARFFVLTD